MRNWLKYLLLFCVLIFSTGITMAQGPYEFTGSNTGQQTASANSGTIVYYTYLTVPLNQGNSLRHLDYDISWHSQGFSSVCTNCPAQYGCVKINLYDNAGIFVQTLETIYEYDVTNGGSYYSYTGSLDFNVLILSGYEIRVVLQAQWPGWTSYVNSATITAVTGPLNEILIFEDDFQTSPISPEWSTTSGVLPVLFSYNSTQVFGPFGDQGTINLDLSALPTHTYIRVEFDLYVFDSWDGSNDDWKLKVDGVDRIHTDFDNHTWNSAPGNMQSYPHNVEFSNLVLTGAFLTGLPYRCWSSQPNPTSMYKINNITPHTGTSLTIGLQGLGLSGLCDESWGIDNVKVYALGCQGVVGCTDPTACNYAAAATCDDGLCDYSFGCMDATACNYDALALCDDGSCLTAYGCMDATACNYDSTATCDDGLCDLPDGCMDPLACNYDASATCDDGSCLTDYGCMDPSACNYDASATCDDGSCTGLWGCTNPTACNYDPLATCDDGSCVTAVLTIDIANLQHIACPNGNTGEASILLSDYTNHSWLNISNGQFYNGGGGNGGLSRNDLDAGFYVITASIPSNPLCNYVAYSDTFEIIETEPVFQYAPTQSCPGECNVTITADMLVAISGVTYTYELDANPPVSLPSSLSNQCGGAHTYQLFADGIGCGVEDISISQQAPMNLSTSVTTAPTCIQQGSATVVIESVGSSGLDTYCDSEPHDNQYTTIDNVVLTGNTTTISNNTSSIPDIYTDFTSLSADLDPGSSYNLTINIGSASTVTYFVDIANVYIDWNIDGDFNDTNELVGQVGSTQSPSSHTIVINVPATAIPGQSRMRIVAQDVQNQPGNQALPCDYQSAWFGSTEDYTIQVNGSVATPITYLWDDPLAQTTATANLGAGTYTVTITDANGCTASDIVIINVLAELDIDSLIASPNPACEGDTIIIEAFPNNPLYEYKFKYRDASTSWSNITSYGGWLSTNNIQYGPILQDTDFRVKIRNASDGSCPTNWLPSNQGITVPVNPIPSSGPIWHN